MSFDPLDGSSKVYFCQECGQEVHEKDGVAIMDFNMFQATTDDIDRIAVEVLEGAYDAIIKKTGKQTDQIYLTKKYWACHNKNNFDLCNDCVFEMIETGEMAIKYETSIEKEPPTEAYETKVIKVTED